MLFSANEYPDLNVGIVGRPANRQRYSFIVLGDSPDIRHFHMIQFPRPFKGVPFVTDLIVEWAKGSD